MGLFWGSSGGKSTKKPGKSAGGRTAAAAPAAAAERETAAAAAPPEVAAPTGCMCAVLQMFDLHQFQMALHHQPSFRPAVSLLHDEPCVPRKGLEAPRNSLELDEPAAVTESDSPSSSTLRKEQENLNIPVNIQIKTTRSPRASFSKPDLFSDSCSSNSPAAGGNKTPTLVARLMGLDQLPPHLQTSTTPPAYGTTHKFRREHYNRRPGGLQHILSQNRSSCSSHRRSFYDNDVMAGGTVSLPETPRISSASSRRSDVDHGHRLSLQINKENINVGEDFEVSRNSARKRRELMNYKRADEDLIKKSGSDYAKEIVKQIKESVVRRKVAGLNDITNTVKSRDQKVMRTNDGVGDDHVVLLKPEKPSKVNASIKKLGHESAGPSKQSTPSCSPRLLDIINEPKNQTNSQSPRPLSPWSQSPQNQQPGKVQSTPNPPQHLGLRDPELQRPGVQVKKSKKDDKEKSGSGTRRTPQAVVDPIMKKKEEPFIRPTTAQKGNNVTEKKCKRTPISNDIFNISVPNLLPVKKQSQASSDGEALWKSSPQISSGSSPAYKLKQQQQQPQVTHTTLNSQENSHQDRNYYRTTTSSSASGYQEEVVELEYRNYIQRILKRAGVDLSTPVCLAKWYSPSHPLDPSIFHYIELFHPTVTDSDFSPGTELSLRCNRKLVFQLVDELLADILKPNYLVGKGSNSSRRDKMYGSELVDILCTRIKKFPRAECKVLEDIDALIDTDLGNGAGATSSSSSSWVNANYEEEGRDELVEEIQRDIMKSLVHDTAMATRTVQVF